MQPDTFDHRVTDDNETDIGGLDDIIEELKESVIYPLTLPHLYSYSSPLLSAPSGVLLYGPPGCGKTMLAKALAHESGACFINLHISTLTDKWYGDSNKLVNAVFSLARKLQPSIVFIDEIDAVLGTRRSTDHEASGMVKAEYVISIVTMCSFSHRAFDRFMTHWDGLASATTSGAPQRILILGATNRIQDIDEAILRRMPKKFPVSLPSATRRRRILSLVLRDTKLDRENFDAETVVRATAGMSGSDIKEACRDAAMVPVREFIRESKGRGQGIGSVSIDVESVRGLRTDDFFAAARKGSSWASAGADEFLDGAAGVDDDADHREYQTGSRRRRHGKGDQGHHAEDPARGASRSDEAEQKRRDGKANEKSRQLPSSSEEDVDVDVDVDEEDEESSFQESLESPPPEHQ